MLTNSEGRAAQKSSNPSLTVLILSLTGLSVSIMQTLVVPLLPHLPQMLDADPANTTWVLTITLMVGAVCTPIGGRLGDMFGKKRMLLVSLAMMVVGSTICALSTSLTTMLIGRACQGAAIGAVSLGISLLRDVLPRERLGSAVAMMSSTLGVGGAIGLPVAAVVAQYASWHWLFVGSALFGVAAFIAIIVAIPESHIRTGGRFDAPGAALLSLVLVSLLFALTKANTWGWTDSKTIGLLVLAAVTVLVFIAIERRTTQPLVDIEVSARPAVLFTNLASITVGFAMYTINLVMTQVLQAPASTGFGFGQSMVVAGLCSAPMGFMMMVGSPLAARIIAAYGPKFSLRLGVTVIAVGFTFGIFALHSLWQAILVSLFVGAGVALSYAAMPTLIMRSAPPTQTAAANSVNTLSRSVGTSVASAVHGAILAATLAGVPQFFGPLNAFQMCFVLAVLACAAAFGFASLIPRQAGVPSNVTDTEALAGIEGVTDARRVPEPRRGLQRMVHGPGVAVRRTVRSAVGRRPAARQGSRSRARR